MGKLWLQDLDRDWQDFLLDVTSKFLSKDAASYIRYSAVMCSARLLSFQSKWCEQTGNAESIIEDIAQAHLSLSSSPQDDTDKRPPNQFPSVEKVQTLIQKFLFVHAQNFPEHIANGCIYQICKAVKSGILLVCSCPIHGLRLEDNIAKSQEVQELKRFCRLLLYLLCSKSTTIPLGDIYETVRKNISQINVSLAGIQVWVEERVGIDFNHEEDTICKQQDANQ